MSVKRWEIIKRSTGSSHWEDTAGGVARFFKQHTRSEYDVVKPSKRSTATSARPGGKAHKRRVAGAKRRKG